MIKISNNDLSNVLRILSMDIVENAKSGHPGAPMGMADIAEVLWRNYINHNPNNPNWINRDRFILSNGHCSALLYSILHLSGYNISINDLKNFRKINSITPGHPEYKITPGVEITTGPLGQGLANAVGFAIGEKLLSFKFNKNNFNIIDNYTYVFAGDGCLMEGISHEACSLAGTLKLNKLIVFYDSNNISIDGDISDWYTDDTKKRFKSYNWNVIKIDGHNKNMIKRSINKSKNSNKPTLIICNTIIGYGSPNKSKSNISHGSPLGYDETFNVRDFLNWKYDPFEIPKEIYKKWNFSNIGNFKENKWNHMFSKYEKEFNDLYNELSRRINKIIPNELNINIDNYINKIKYINNIISTRKASQNVLECIYDTLPELIGGSADLTSSNLTNCSKSISINKSFLGNYIHYGVREFGMSAIGNGISIYNGFIPYSGTFLSFMDYSKSAIRMACLMKLKHIFIYTHDSIGLGEDGPTHQPIEHLTDLRIIPNLYTWRPCDELETLIAWKNSIYRNGTSAIVLSRQDLININTRNDNQINNINKGGYILYDCNNIIPQIIIISTGSEIILSISVRKMLIKLGYEVRLISMPSTNLFDDQNYNYKNYLLPKKSFKVVIEASHCDYWNKYINNNGIIIGMKTFGKSGSKNELFDYFGFNKETIVNKIIDSINIKNM